MQLIEKVIYFGYKIAEDYPPVDIYETDTAYFIIFDLAGVQRQNIILKICDENLIIMGTRGKRVQFDYIIWHCKELHSDNFQRRIPLPEDIEPSQAEAFYKDGELKVKIPKKSKRVYKIEIKGE